MQKSNETNYCNKNFWEDTSKKELLTLESSRGSWIGWNKNTEAGDYLPNEFDGSCGETSKASYIVGGEDAKIGEFPFIAAVGMKEIIFEETLFIQLSIIDT